MCFRLHEIERLVLRVTFVICFKIYAHSRGMNTNCINGIVHASVIFVFFRKEGRSPRGDLSHVPVLPRVPTFSSTCRQRKRGDLMQKAHSAASCSTGRELNSSKLHVYELHVTRITGFSPRSQPGGFSRGGGLRTKRQRTRGQRVCERWKGPKLYRCRCCTRRQEMRP